MGRVIYIPEKDKIWIDYYLSQASQQGHGGFVGIPYQRGHGLGSFFGRLFRSILPVAKRIGKSALKSVGKEALNMGSNVMHDISEGKSVKQSLKRHGAKAAGNLGEKALRKLSQSGNGLGKRPVGSRSVSVPKKKTRRLQTKTLISDYLS